MKYIGITGINERVSLEFLRNCVASMPDEYKFMAGILVDRKILDGEAPRKMRHCAIEHLSWVVRVCKNIGAMPVIHYNRKAGDQSDVLEWLWRQFDCPIQMNWANPDLEELRRLKKYCPLSRVILQINPASVGENPSSRTVIEYAEKYAGLVSAALLDLSAGTGKPANIELARQVRLNWPYKRMSLGLAGGLDAKTVSEIAQLRVSVDAESRLRTPDDELDEAKAMEYVRAASRALESPFAARFGDCEILERFFLESGDLAGAADLIAGLRELALLIAEKLPEGLERDDALRALLSARDAIARA